MSSKNNRERILLESVDLFNRYGVVPMTTNHISKQIGISPGNLYFHFRNKEEIVCELFQRMCDDSNAIWETRPVPPPLELMGKVLNVHWHYRFLHREFYTLRRKDENLAKLWARQLKVNQRLMKLAYAGWVKRGYMRRGIDSNELELISNSVLIAGNHFLQFFESPEKPASDKPLRRATEHLVRLLLPYHLDPEKARLQSWLQNPKLPLDFF